jgi:hypothetical protein
MASTRSCVAYSEYDAAGIRHDGRTALRLIDDKGLVTEVRADRARKKENNAYAVVKGKGNVLNTDKSRGIKVQAPEVTQKKFEARKGLVTRMTGDAGFAEDFVYNNLENHVETPQPQAGIQIDRPIENAQQRRTMRGLTGNPDFANTLLDDTSPRSGERLAALHTDTMRERQDHPQRQGRPRPTNGERFYDADNPLRKKRKRNGNPGATPTA